MPGTRSSSALRGVPTEEIRRQVNQVLNSKTFQGADRLRQFLKFVVEEALAGRSSGIKEYVIGTEVFGKDESFDPRTEPIVRVQARRLRARLARYYREEDQTATTQIELPKGGYTPVFRRVEGATRRPVTAAFGGRNKVAVLPIVDDSPDHDLQYFCNGLANEIIYRLSKIEAIQVVGWSMNRDWEHSRDANQVPDVQNAAIILSGSVRKTRNRLRITVHLIDGATRGYVWSCSFDRDPDEVLDVQEEVSKTIFDKLNAELASDGIWKRGKGQSENLAARNLCAQGRFHLGQRSENGLRRAVEFFNLALVEDAHCIEAFCGLADGYLLQAHYGMLAPSEVWTKAASSATTAVMLDDNSAQAHSSLAHVKSTQDWDWVGAEAEFQRAISLDTSYPTAHHWYGMTCLAPMGRLDEAKNEVLLARKLDPISSIISRDLALISYFRDEQSLALEHCADAVALNPLFPAAYWMLGLVKEQLGDFDESSAAFQRAIELAPKSPRMHAALGRTFALSKRRADAIRVLGELEGLAKERYVSPFELATVHFALGEEEVGFESLMDAFADRCFELIWLKVDPRFDHLRQHPRFISLYARLGLE